MNHAIRLVLCSLAAAPLAAQHVSPTDRSTFEGVNHTHYPLGRFDARLQTLHDDLPATLTTIQGHAYRRDAEAVHGRVGAFRTELEVTLSMAPHAAAQASSTFANNVGTSPVVVLPRTTLSFPATDRPASDPAPTFELVVPYQVPFNVPAGGGTLCVDTSIFSNSAPTGANRNFFVYHDAHEVPGGGANVVPGYRTGQGCPPPGSTAETYAVYELDRDPAGGLALDLSIRNGVPDDGSGHTIPLLTGGVAQASVPLPSRFAPCTVLTTLDMSVLLPGPMSTSGRWQGTHPLPALPAGFRAWFQCGSFDVRSSALTLGDVSGITVPDAGPQNVPVMRIAHGSDHTSATGTVNPSVPVTLFF